MSDEPFKTAVDHERRIIEIQGIRYSFDLFDMLATGPTGARFEIVGRSDGVVELKTLPSDSGAPP